MLLQPFVPKLALRLLRGAPALPQAPYVETFPGVALMADVSGFSPLVDALAARYGDRGAEQLQEILNRYFGPLTDVVEASGGEVVCFPGDAALALWTAADDTPETLALVIQRATACGLQLQSVLGRLPAVDGIELRLRVAIGAGRAWAALVGGADARWETVLQGEPVEQLSETLGLASRGELLLSAAACAAVARVGSAISGDARGGCLVVRNAGAPVRLVPAASAVPSDDIIRALAPASVVARVEAGQRAWLAEFRQLSVAFVYVKAGGAERPEDLERLHHTVRVVQDAVLRFAGVVNQIVFDEKGLTIVLAFGIAQRAHEDDASRAVRTALEIREQLTATGVDGRVGLASGRVFTGGRGGESRLEFAVLGSTVVLAARLAWVADDVLCDGATRAASRKNVRFAAVPPLALKGKADRVEAWRPVSIKDGRSEGDGRGPIGRDRERDALEARLTQLELTGQGGVVILEGEPGIGKTTLVSALLRNAQSRGVRSLVGAGDAIEQRTAYRPWRSVVARLLGADAASDVPSLTARLVQLLGADNEVWLPLLNPVLPRPLPETDQVRQLNPDSRARTTSDLLVSLLDTAASVTPLLVVLEDAHWMDSASWELAESAGARVPRLLLVLSTRPAIDGHAAASRLSSSATTERIRLGLLSDVNVRDVIARRLDVDEIPDELVALICPRAEGHPMFAEEMAVALRDAGAFTVREGTCRLNAEGLGASTSLPTTIQGVVATRIDQLTPQEQMTLKVAAVLGRQFLLHDLAQVHPLGEARDLLVSQTQRIALAGLLVADPDSAQCSFSHALVQEVAYELLPYTQRRELHRRTAEWLEGDSGQTSEDLAPVLAHHWERAEVADKTMHYLEKAGEAALFRQSSNPEAAEFFTRLIALADKQPGIGAVALAKWERMLAQALARLGRHDQARERFERAITRLGDTPPVPGLSCGIEFLRGLVMRLLRQPREVREPVRGDKAMLLERARAYEAYVRLSYLGRSRTIPSQVATLRSVTAAERAGPGAELCNNYALFANFAALFRRERLATYYSSQARVVAERIGDRHALFRALTIGQLPAFSRGAWAEATRGLDEGLALGEELRIIREYLIFACARASASFNQGLLPDALSRFTDIANRAEATGDLVPRLWAIMGTGEIAFRRGDLTEAIACAERCLELAKTAETVEQNALFQAHGLLASAWLRQAGPDRAARHVQPAMEACHAGAFLGFAAQAGFVGVAEVLFALEARGGGEGVDAGRKLKRWLRLLRLAAFGRPILEPWDLYFRASWQRLHGLRMVGVRRLRRAVRLADRLQMPYEACAARLELARLLSSDDPERLEMLARARQVSEEIGAVALVPDHLIPTAAS